MDVEHCPSICMDQFHWYLLQIAGKQHVVYQQFFLEHRGQIFFVDTPWFTCQGWIAPGRYPHFLGIIPSATSRFVADDSDHLSSYPSIHARFMNGTKIASTTRDEHGQSLLLFCLRVDPKPIPSPFRLASSSSSMFRLHPTMDRCDGVFHAAATLLSEVRTILLLSIRWCRRKVP